MDKTYHALRVVVVHFWIKAFDVPERVFRYFFVASYSRAQGVHSHISCGPSEHTCMWALRLGKTTTVYVESDWL